jgi:hypothetical protein
MMEYKILATKNGQAFYHVIYNWQDAESTIEEFLRSGCNVEVWHGETKFVPSLKQEQQQ